MEEQEPGNMEEEVTRSAQGEVPGGGEEDVWKSICEKLSPVDIQVEEQTNKSREEEIK